jgi:hypothetical protein
MTFQVSGAQGGKSGGQGGRVTGTLSKIPATLYIAVGGSGTTGASAAGGFNGGGQAGSGSNNEGSGGGSSDIRLSTNVESRIVVAGGGGGRGAGITPTPSPGGGLIAAAGKDGQAGGGGGGTQTSGGAGGAANGNGTSGSAGSLLTGGTGGSSSLYGGGGGGGGYYGGGGGGSDTDSASNDAGAGGGGSSYSDSLYTSNITHFTGVKSGHGLVMIEYQLVPLFQSINTQRQLTKDSSIDFQIELSGPFPAFSESHIEITGDQATCQSGSLTGSGSSYIYTLVDCNDGQVGISIPENSISETGYVGPEATINSEIVVVDRTAPEIVEIKQEDSELIIPITEPVIAPEPDSYSLLSASSDCQVETIVASNDQLWLASLVGCEDLSFSFTILAGSISDLAGNTGPAENILFEVSVPLPEVASTPEAVTPAAQDPEAAQLPEASKEPEVLAPASSVSAGPGSPPFPVVTEDQVVNSLPELGPVPTEDAELIQLPTPRKQAAQSVIATSVTQDSASSTLGWTVGLVIAGVLLLVAGLSLRRRGVSDLLVS